MEEPMHDETRLTLEELAAAAGLSRTRVVRLVQVGLIEPAAPGTAEFTAEAAARLRRMLRLHADLGVNLLGASIILDLVDRMRALEAERARDRSEERG